MREGEKRARDGWRVWWPALHSRGPRGGPRAAQANDSPPPIGAATTRNRGWLGDILQPPTQCRGRPVLLVGRVTFTASRYPSESIAAWPYHTRPAPSILRRGLQDATVRDHRIGRSMGFGQRMQQQEQICCRAFKAAGAQPALGLLLDNVPGGRSLGIRRQGHLAPPTAR